MNFFVFLGFESGRASRPKKSPSLREGCWCQGKINLIPISWFLTDIWRGWWHGRTWFFSNLGVCVDLPEYILRIQHWGNTRSWDCSFAVKPGQIWTNNEGWDWRDKGNRELCCKIIQWGNDNCWRWLKWRWTPFSTQSSSVWSTTAARGRLSFLLSTQTSALCM